MRSKMLCYWSHLPTFVAIVISLFPASVRCKAQSANTEAESRPVLRANTRVFLRLTKTLAKHDTRPGEPVEFVVDSNVVVNGRVLINGGMMVSGSFRGLNQSGKDLSRVLFDLGPLQTTTGETVRLTGLGAKSNRPDVVGAIDWGGQAGALAPLVIPAFVIVEVFHQKNVLIEQGACVVAEVAEDVALDPSKVLQLPRDQYGASARDRFPRPPCNSPPLHTISEYRANVTRNPDDLDARIGLIEALDDSGDIATAFAEVEEAIPIWPDAPYLRYLRGRLLVEKNEPDAAIVELQWALQKTNNRLSPANCALGRAFELKGNLKAALGQYHTAYRAHTLDEQCRAAYERLRLQPKK